MPVKIMIDPNKVSSRVMTAWNAGLPQLSEEILADCNEYCKEESRTLILSSESASILEEGKLVWDTKYAKRQYWEIQTSLKRGRTWKWCETAKRKRLKEWRKKAERGLKDNL